MEGKEKTEKGWKEINGCSAVTHSSLALPVEHTEDLGKRQHCEWTFEQPGKYTTHWSIDVG